MSAAKAKKNHEQRVLILAPTGRDAELTARVLREAQLTADVCNDIDEVCAGLVEGAGLVFVTGEALTEYGMTCLLTVLSRHPAWSDIPIIILTSGGGDTPADAAALQALIESANVTLIERPVRVMTLLTTVKSALRARRRQYEVRNYLTAEIRAKQALEQSEQRLRIALDAAQLGAWQLELATGRLECTVRVKANFGLRPDSDVSYDRLMAMIHPEDKDLVRAAIENAINNHELYQAEYRTIWNDGSQHWIMASGRSNYDQDGRPLNMLGVTLDITDRKSAEEERERLLQKTQEANRLKDEFLATVSHELRTPLNAVLGWVHLLRSNNLDDEGKVRALETIERNAKAQQQLIEDLLDVSRIITGKLRLDVKPVEPSTFIDAALEAVSPAANAKGILIERICDPGVSMVSGDPARLQQVVWNLLSNAIKFTPRGGRVQLRLSRHESQVEFSIADTGQGIGPEFLPFVFERFRQADMKTTRAHGGLGLGLAIVRQLVELHGGTIDVDSPGEGQGSTFVVKLPVVAVYQDPAADERIQQSISDVAARLDPLDDLSGINVLVVDDDIDTCELMDSLLTQCGAAVTTVKSASDAIEFLRRHVPDVIISDVGMPGVDGYEFIRKVRSLPPERGGKIPAVALTAYARGEDRLRALRAGYQMHVAKPIEVAELLTIVASLTERTQSRTVKSKQ